MLKIFGEDQVCRQRGAEALDSVFHVRAGELLEVVEDSLGRVVESVVEAISDVLAENA